MQNAAIKHWIMAIRPKTLFASISPVLLAGALAGKTDPMSILLFISCMSVAVLLQSAANLANDYYDWHYGTDRSDRLGPARVTAGSLIKAEHIKAAFLLLIAASAVPGLFIVFCTDRRLIILGAVCMILAVAYTAKPLKLAYRGFGETAAFIFFGVVPCSGTYYVLTGGADIPSLLGGIMCGLFAAAIMAVNNLRDIHTDKLSGKTTIAGIIGEKKARIFTVSLITAAILSPAAIAAASGKPLVMLAVIMLVTNIKSFKRLLTEPVSKSFNLSLAATAKTEFFSTAATCILWLI
jgi:1,4-dihydroxy-2-naphthoate polyprenyltransferase